MFGEEKVYLIIGYTIIGYLFVIYKKDRGIRNIRISPYLEIILYPFMRKNGESSIFSLLFAIYLIISNIVGYVLIFLKEAVVFEINSIWMMSSLVFIFLTAAIELLFGLPEIKGKVKKIVIVIVSIYIILLGGMIALTMWIDVFN